jgi:hypothetical protein
MATIPMGNFGQRSPGRVRWSTSRAAIRWATPRSASSRRSVIANDAAERQTKLQDEQRRAQAALTLAKTTNDMHAAHDEVAQAVTDGTIAPDKAAASCRTVSARSGTRT